MDTMGNMWGTWLHAARSLDLTRESIKLQMVRAVIWCLPQGDGGEKEGPHVLLICTWGLLTLLIHGDIFNLSSSTMLARAYVHLVHRNGREITRSFT